MKNINEEKCQNIATILVCIDTTKASFTALKYACLTAKKLCFNVQILSVLEPSHKNLIFGAHQIAKEKRKIVENHLNKLINEINNEINFIPAISIKEGDISSEIANEIKANPSCVMVVFGKSDKSQSDNNVLPKMAQKIGRKIKIPIVIVPENLDNNLFQLIK